MPREDLAAIYTIFDLDSGCQRHCRFLHRICRIDLEGASALRGRRIELEFTLYKRIRFVDTMHIGELARSAQVNVQTIRFYERQGLLPRPVRTATGYRVYEARDLERVIFIKRNQELGFTLAEIQPLFEIHERMMRLPRSPRRKSNEIQAILAMGRERLQTINAKIRTLHDMRRNLVAVVKHLDSANVPTCPVVNSPAKRKRKNLKNSL